jgi:pSer/pThr/pTyr-binding forkhead associated (FHA) protein
MGQDIRDSKPSLRFVIAAERRSELDAGAPSSSREFKLDRSRLSIGRRPYNDIALDHVTVSGEHAILEMKGSDYELLDTGSSNGSFVNGLRVTRKRLRPGDYVGIGIFQMQLVSDQLALASAAAASSASTGVAATDGAAIEGTAPRATGIPPQFFKPLDGSRSAQIEYLNGPLKGIRQAINRSILKIGRGAEVAVIGRRREGYFLTHLEGLKPSLLNGEALIVGSRNLSHGDLIQLGEIRIRFTEVETSDESSNSEP